MTNKLSLNQIAADSKALNKMVGDTVKAYKALSVRLHHTACAVLFHVAEHGECHAMNEFYKGLRVNDQTALRVWLGTHATYLDIETGEMRQWLTFTVKDGFRVVKGTTSHRVGMFVVEAEQEDEVRTVLVNLKPFFDKNVKDKDAITLEALLTMLGKAAERVTKQAKDEGIDLPADVLALTTSVKNTTAKELEALERVKSE